MKPLHDDNDRALVLVVQALDDFGIEPFVDRTATWFVVHPGGRDRIVDHDQIGAAADQNAANHA